MFTIKLENMCTAPCPLRNLGEFPLFHACDFLRSGIGFKAQVIRGGWKGGKKLMWEGTVTDQWLATSGCQNNALKWNQSIAFEREKATLERKLLPCSIIETAGVIRAGLVGCFWKFDSRKILDTLKVRIFKEFFIWQQASCLLNEMKTQLLWV